MLYSFLVSKLPYVIGEEELNPFGQLSSVCTKKLYFIKVNRRAI